MVRQGARHRDRPPPGGGAGGGGGPGPPPPAAPPPPAETATACRVRETTYRSATSWATAWN
ncbi:hypothetical protein, partial [Nocardia farcinica]|uniref:hypothetical protein n=1 Tax=Nocardia farcinica TaxID=37329 RepID=UPI002457EF39